MSKTRKIPGTTFRSLSTRGGVDVYDANGSFLGSLDRMTVSATNCDRYRLGVFTERSLGQHMTRTRFATLADAAAALQVARDAVRAAA